MKIAIATENNQVSDHFGRCEQFTIVEIENGQVIQKNLINTQDHLHGQLPLYLITQGALIVLAGGMGEGARKNLRSNGVEIITGVHGTIDETIEAYMGGKLKTDDAHYHDHHDHHHHHEHSDHHHGDGGGQCQCKH